MSDGGADEVTVRSIMRHGALWVSPDDTIETVAKLMATHHISAAPVVADGRLVGIITESDLIFREADVSIPATATFLDAIVVGDAGSDFDDDLRRVLAVTAGQLMSSPVYSIRDRATVSEVATLLVERDISQAPVVDDDNNLIGLIGRPDLVRVIARLEKGDVPFAELNADSAGA